MILQKPYILRILEFISIKKKIIKVEFQLSRSHYGDEIRNFNAKLSESLEAVCNNGLPK